MQMKVSIKAIAMPSQITDKTPMTQEELEAIRVFKLLLRFARNGDDNAVLQILRMLNGTKYNC